MITGLAFIPSTPLLVPEVARGAASEIDGVRQACHEAFARVRATDPERVIIVGAGSETRELRAGTGSLHGFGVAHEVSLDPSTRSSDRLPLSLALGAWLLERETWQGERAALELDPASGRATLASVATALAQEAFRSALVVVADGSAALTDKAPASLHPEAQAVEAQIATALASGHPAHLAELDQDALLRASAAGGPAWFVAGVASAVDHDGTWDAVLHAHEWPYGVGYAVASWVR